MVGREAELTRIEELLAIAADGAVGIAITGPPGIGKTAVWRAAVESARSRGYQVLVATPGEAETTLSFSGLGDLFDGLDDGQLDCLPDPQRRALRAALFLSEPDDAPGELDALPRAVLGVLRHLAADRTVVVAIDDEQWLDHASARALAFALRRIRPERICLLLSRRADSDAALWPDVRYSFGGGIEVIELAGLDVTATDRLLRALPGPVIPRRLLERLQEVSGGNPLFALALGTELKRTPSRVEDWDELPIPDSLGSAIAQRLEHVRGGIEAELFAIAALAEPTVALLDLAFDDFHVADLDPAVGAGVIEITEGRVRFTHPLLASVHYASVPVAERRTLHLRLAGVAANPEERAQHLARGTETPDQQVADELEEAAALAVRRGAPEAAADLLEHAIRLTPTDERAVRWSRMADAADQRYFAGELTHARQLVEQLLLEQPGGRVSARARLRLALVRTDDFEFGATMLEQALVDAAGDDRLITQIALVYSDLSANLGDYAGVVERAELALASAKRLEEPGLVAPALAALGAGRFQRGHGLDRALFERAIELERGGGESIQTFYLPSTTYGTLLRQDYDLDAARPLLEQAVARARQRGDEGDALIPLLVRLARLESDAGNPAAADQWFAQASEAARQQTNNEMDSWVAHAEGEIAASRGQFEHAQRRAEEALRLADVSGDVQMQRDTEVLLATIELMSGDAASAHTRLQKWRAATLAHGPWYIGWLTLTLWSADIEALVALGRLDDAQALLAELRERARAYPNPHVVAVAWRCDGLLLAARGRLADAIKAMDAALAEHRHTSLPLEIGRTLLEKGSIERRAKRKSAAKRTLEQALTLLTAGGAAAWAARARDELSRIGLRRAAVSEGLTPAQQRVADLAAGGATNREIAQALHMSASTVESHLTKVYGELKIRSRAQLATALASHNTNRTSERVHETRDSRDP